MQFFLGPNPERIRNKARRLLPFLAFGLLLSLPLAAQKKKPAPSVSIQQQLQQRYDAARTFQISGDAAQASKEYKLFLGQALAQTAQAYGAAGDWEEAAYLLNDSLKLAPENSERRLSYAMVLFQQQKLDEAQQEAEQALKATPKNPQALLLLGRLAYSKGDYNRARDYLESTVVLASNFDVGYLLGMTYVKLNDFKRTRVLFDEMVTGLGDSPQIHIYFGRAYADGDTEGLDNAVAEFEKAIAKDPKVRQAHYFLALSYLNRDGESGFEAAVPALKAEIALNPDDSRSHYLLGYIAMKQRQFEEAEKELTEASRLDSDNPDPLIYLGQLYADANRDQAAETALRKAIALTTDVSRNGFQINRAHYVLARVLLRTNRKEEAQKELDLSKELRDHIRSPEKMKEEIPSLGAQRESTAQAPVSPEAAKTADALASQLRPSIADAYNNLGVILAGQKQFGEALIYFRKAYEWQPSLETLARNLGMAAFYGNQFAEAVPPLTQHVAQHPDDSRARAALGLSYFMVQNFPKVMETLYPMRTSVDSDPGLAYAYAVALLKTGSYDEGVQRLKALETAKENSAEIHALLGQAYADQNDYTAAIAEYRKSLAVNANQPQTHYLLGLSLLKSGTPAEATEEFRTAVKMDPKDAAKKYHLAFSLIQVQQKDEARNLLQEVIKEDPKYADAYYELGKLQLEQGDAKAAIASFETGTQLSPDSDYIHYQLAIAYRRDSRMQDAEREIKLYQTLKNRHRGRDVPEAN